MYVRDHYLSCFLLKPAIQTSCLLVLLLLHLLHWSFDETRGHYYAWDVMLYHMHGLVLLGIDISFMLYGWSGMQSIPSSNSLNSSPLSFDYHYYPFEVCLVLCAHLCLLLSEISFFKLFFFCFLVFLICIEFASISGSAMSFSLNCSERKLSFSLIISSEKKLSLFNWVWGGVILIVIVTFDCWIKDNTWLGYIVCIALLFLHQHPASCMYSSQASHLLLGLLLCICILPIVCIALKLPTFCLNWSFTVTVSLPFAWTIAWYQLPAYSFIIYC